jgi:hypothetical protein
MSDREDDPAVDAEEPEDPEESDGNDESSDGGSDLDDDLGVAGSAATFDFPGPQWMVGLRDGATQPPMRVVIVPKEGRVTADTMSPFEFARLVGLEAVHDRTSDDAVAGAKRRVYEGQTSFTIRRTVRMIPPVYGAGGGLKREGEMHIEVWRSSELRYPHPPPDA